MMLAQAQARRRGIRQGRGAGLARALRCAALGGAVATVALAGFAPPSDAAYSNSPSSTWATNGPVYALATKGNITYLGGNFSKLVNPVTGAKVPAHNVAAINRKTGRPLAGFSASTNDTVQSLAVSGDGKRLYVGGNFNVLDGATARHLAVVSPANGNRFKSFKGSVSGNVLDMAVDHNSLYLGGQFQEVDGVSRSKLAKLNATSGGVVSAWHPKVNGGVYAIAMLPQRRGLVVGGRFHSVNSQTRLNLAIVALGSGSPLAWHPRPHCHKGCPVFDLAANKASVFAAIGGPGGTLTAFNSTSGTKRWADHADGDVQSLWFSGSQRTLYVGGHFDRHFTTVSGKVVRHQLAAVRPGNGAIFKSLHPHLTRQFPGVWALLALPHTLVVGGGFRGVPGQFQPHYAQFRSR